MRTLWICLLLLFSNLLQAQLSEQQFNRPETTYAPRVFWQWMNGNVTREGINLDLEAMAATGLGGGILFNNAVGIPAGPVKYNSAEWTELTIHALQQADRLGLKLMFHNAPGYSGTGGPWITPENAMQQVVWSEAFVKGGESVTLQLPKPFAKQDYYKDIAVLAFPCLKGEEQPFRSLLQFVTVSGKPVDARILTDFDFHKSIFLDKVPAEMVLTLNEPLEAACFIVHREKTPPPGHPYDGPRDNPPTLQLESSNDGILFAKVCDLSMPALRTSEVPAFVNFPPVKAKYFRIRSNKPTNLTEVELAAAPRIEGWDWKANFQNNAGSFNLNLLAAKQRGIFDSGKEKVNALTPPQAAGNARPEFNTNEPTPGSVVNASAIMDLTKQMAPDGSLTWDAPKGNWTIVRIGHTITGEEQAAAPQSCVGLDVDKLSLYGVQQHYDKFLKPLFDQTRPYHGRSLEGLTIDSWEVGCQNWTRDMLPEFGKRAGYDLKTYLLTFTGRNVNSAIQTERFLWDLRRVQSDMLVEYYYGGMRDILHKEGLILSAEPYGDGSFESMQAGFIAHTWGLPNATAESFTEYPSVLKADGDWMFTNGVNRLVFNAYVHQSHPTAEPGTIMGPFGTNINRNNTWFSKATDYFEYLRRCQYVLQSGIFVADAAYFLGEEVVESVHLQNPNPGHAFDVLSRDALLQRASAKNNRLVLLDGMSYRFLILPENKPMSLPVLRKLKALLEDGLWISAPKPTTWPGLISSKDQAEWQAIVEDLWNKLPDGIYRYGSGRLFINMPAGKLFEESRLKPDFSYVSSNSNAVINYLHRRIGSDDAWFVCNNRRQNDNILASFRIIGMQPEWWNPQTGEIRAIDIFRQHDEQTLIPLTLQPSESGFVVFRKPLKQTVFDGLMKDGVPLVSANPDDFEIPAPLDLKTNFSVSVWAKPDVVANKDRSFLLYPVSGATKYGAGNATIGLAIGQNGVRVYEQETRTREVLFVPQKLEGWNLITIIYKNNTPIIYINGVKAAEGKKSPCIVHANDNELAPTNPLFQIFQGENTRPQWSAETLDSAAVANLFAHGKPAIGLPETLMMNGNHLFRTKGSYSLLKPSLPIENKSSLLIKKDLPVYDLSKDWIIRFPEGKGAPEQFKLDSLTSLHTLKEFGVKYFSGTASWQRSFTLTLKDLTGNNLILDLGQVANMAEVYVNGTSAGICWKPPFRLDLTNLLKPGENQLDIRVTNLWVNRLIGDEFLPAENEYDAWGEITALPDWYTTNQPKTGERITFVTWKQYDQNSPLVESGLVGPVTLSVWKALKE